MIPFYHQRGPVHTEDLIRRAMSRMARVLALRTATAHACRSMQRSRYTIQALRGVRGFVDTSSAIYLTGVIDIPNCR
jgi:hypothetical protein